MRFDHTLWINQGSKVVGKGVGKGAVGALKLTGKGVVGTLNAADKVTGQAPGQAKKRKEKKKEKKERKEKKAEEKAQRKIDRRRGKNPLRCYSPSWMYANRPLCCCRAYWQDRNGRQRTEPAGRAHGEHGLCHG